MLFPYNKVDHNIKNLQVFVEDLVLNVWCSPSGNFNVSKLHPGFQPIVNKSKKGLKAPIAKIYNTFRKKLSKQQRDTIKKGFKKNKEVEKLCSGALSPFLMEKVGSMNKQLAIDLKDFFEYLYTKATYLKVFSNSFGNIDQYYDQFLTSNGSQCPFCGITTMLDEEMDVRDAFDHYLPQAHFPFISVHLENIIPACKYCNESFKSAKNPLNDGSKKRKAFYPFSKRRYKIDISMKLNTSDLSKLKQDDIEIKFKSGTKQDEVDNWNRIYGIEKRYKNEMKKPGEASYWLVRLLDEMPANPKTKLITFEKKITDMKKHFRNDLNFLKAPFFVACKNRGLVK